MIDDQIRIIIEKYFLGVASEEEIRQLNAWYDSFDACPSIVDSFSEEEKKEVSDKMFSVISAVIEKNPDAADNAP